jgi:hypothetical protein
MRFGVAMHKVGMEQSEFGFTWNPEGCPSLKPTRDQKHGLEVVRQVIYKVYAYLPWCDSHPQQNLTL